MARLGRRNANDSKRRNSKAKQAERRDYEVKRRREQMREYPRSFFSFFSLVFFFFFFFFVH